MVDIAEINQAPPPYSVLLYIGRVATPKFVPRNCLRYLQTTLIMGGGRLVSEFMWGIVDQKVGCLKFGSIRNFNYVHICVIIITTFSGV